MIEYWSAVYTPIDFIFPGLFGTAVGTLLAFVIKVDSRPGDLSLALISDRGKSLVWRAQRLGGLVTLVLGQLSFWFGIGLWVT